MRLLRPLEISIEDPAYFDYLYNRLDGRTLEIFEMATKTIASKELLRVLSTGYCTSFYAIDLSKKGYNVVSYDGVPSVAEQAKKIAEKERIEVFLNVGDIRIITPSHDAYDAAIWPNSLYYVIDDRELVQALRNVHDALSATGLLYIVAPNPYSVIENRVEPITEILRIEDAEVIRIKTHSFDNLSSLWFHNHFCIVRQGNETHYLTDRHKIRLYTATELKRALEEVGFKTVTFLDRDSMQETKQSADRLDIIARC